MPNFISRLLNKSFASTVEFYNAFVKSDGSDKSGGLGKYVQQGNEKKYPLAADAFEINHTTKTVNIKSQSKFNEFMAFLQKESIHKYARMLALDYHFNGNIERLNQLEELIKVDASKKEDPFKAVRAEIQAAIKARKALHSQPQASAFPAAADAKEEEDRKARAAQEQAAKLAAEKAAAEKAAAEKAAAEKVAAEKAAAEKAAAEKAAAEQAAKLQAEQEDAARVKAAASAGQGSSSSVSSSSVSLAPSAQAAVAAPAPAPAPAASPAPKNTNVENFLDLVSSVALKEKSIEGNKLLQKIKFLEEAKKLSLDDLYDLLVLMNNVQRGKTRQGVAYADNRFNIIRTEQKYLEKYGKTDTWKEIIGNVKRLSLAKIKTMILTKAQYDKWNAELKEKNGRWYTHLVTPTTSRQLTSFFNQQQIAANPANAAKTAASADANLKIVVGRMGK